uniref:Uncharacterized protein n=1 Tax=Setaria viridis TaxID=4556 RepID=A0A4U6UZ64_SETVI|nr:hypothetical protein SEVIR_4G173600v2 [Setaria viridis]
MAKPRSTKWANVTVSLGYSSSGHGLPQAHLQPMVAQFCSSFAFSNAWISSSFTVDFFPAQAGVNGTVWFVFPYLGEVAAAPSPFQISSWNLQHPWRVPTPLEAEAFLPILDVMSCFTRIRSGAHRREMAVAATALGSRVFSNSRWQWRSKRGVTSVVYL